SMTQDIQGLRSDAEQGILAAVTRANTAMKGIAELNLELGGRTADDASTANLLDQRDHYIDQLAEIMDIKVVQNDHNQVTIFTNSGVQLVGQTAATLAFDGSGAVSANSTWSSDPTERTVGTLVLQGLNGGSVDLIADRSIR